jgi:hypothetical protein
MYGSLLGHGFPGKTDLMRLVGYLQKEKFPFQIYEKDK